MPIFFAKAFPPTVNAAIIAPVMVSISEILPLEANSLYTMEVPATPLTTPHISPITSLQKLDTRGALRIRIKDCLAPLIFLEAMEWKGVSSAAITAMPITSNTTPAMIITSTTMKEKAGWASPRSPVDAKRTSRDNPKETTVIKIPHRTCLFSNPVFRLTGMFSLEAFLYLSDCFKYFFSVPDLPKTKILLSPFITTEKRNDGTLLPLVS